MTGSPTDDWEHCLTVDYRAIDELIVIAEINATMVARVLCTAGSFLMVAHDSFSMYIS